MESQDITVFMLKSLEEPKIGEKAGSPYIAYFKQLSDQLYNTIVIFKKKSAMYKDLYQAFPNFIGEKVKKLTTLRSFSYNREIKYYLSIPAFDFYRPFFEGKFKMIDGIIRMEILDEKYYLIWLLIRSEKMENAGFPVLSITQIPYKAGEYFSKGKTESILPKIAFERQVNNVLTYDNELKPVQEKTQQFYDCFNEDFLNQTAYVSVELKQKWDSVQSNNFIIYFLPIEFDCEMINFLQGHPFDYRIDKFLGSVYVFKNTQLKTITDILDEQKCESFCNLKPKIMEIDMKHPDINYTIFQARHKKPEDCISSLSLLFPLSAAPSASIVMYLGEIVVDGITENTDYYDSKTTITLYFRRIYDKLEAEKQLRVYFAKEIDDFTKSQNN